VPGRGGCWASGGVARLRVWQQATAGPPASLHRGRVERRSRVPWDAARYPGGMPLPPPPGPVRNAGARSCTGFRVRETSVQLRTRDTRPGSGIPGCCVRSSVSRASARNLTQPRTPGSGSKRSSPVTCFDHHWNKSRCGGRTESKVIVPSATPGTGRVGQIPSVCLRPAVLARSR
jgi:hypothetical protein